MRQFLQNATSQDPQVEGSRTVSKQMGQSNVDKVALSSGEYWSRSRDASGSKGKGIGLSSGTTT